MEKYISGLEYQPEQEYDSSSSMYRCRGANFYSLDTFSTRANTFWQRDYYLSGYENDTGEIWHRHIELPEMEEYEEAEKYISAFDIRNAQEYVLFVQVFEEDETVAYLAMRFSFEGDYLGAVDLYPPMQKNGGFLDDGVVFSSASVDGEGHFFLRSIFGEKKILVLDAEGSVLTELIWDKEDAYFSYAMKTEEGLPVFEQHSIAENEMRLVMYDPALGGERVFTEQLPFSSPMGITGDGVLYYGREGRLYRWDLYTGDRGICFDYGELGLGRNELMTCIGISDTGMPLILDCSREKAIICKLGNEPGWEEDPIRLVSLVEDSSFIAASATMFSQEHMEHPILVRQPEGAMESFRARMLADLTAGQGADIYYVSGEDMRVLYEKGVLADLTGVLGEDLRGSLYESALSCGVIDGRQVGLSPEAYVTTLMVSDELWQGDSWTLEEVMAVMEGHPEVTKWMSGSRYMAKINALRLLLLQDLPNSPFLDMETGICDFDNPLFIKALEAVKKATGGKDSPALMNSGRIAAFQVNMESFWEFSADMSDMGEGFHSVGFPTESGSGSYWNADYFLVVNARAKHRELIDDFLAALFDSSRQRELSHPIRNDMLETGLYYMEDSLEYPWQYYIGSGTYYVLTTKPDGSPWTEEYKSILEQAVPRAQNTFYIEEIIVEEADSFISGDKTAAQVAEIIQNRVQLYLDEQR